MILDNSFKICINKSGLVWRVLLYQVLCLVLFAGIGLACFYPLIMELSSCGFLNDIWAFVSNNLFNFRIDQVLGDFAVLVNQFLAIIATNTSLILYVVLFFVIVVMGGYVFLGLVELPLCECIYGYMGSLSKLNFMGYFISNIGRSFRFRFAKLATTFWLDIIIIASFVGILQLFTLGGVVKILAPFVVILALIVLITLRQAAFSLWASSIVVNNIGVWKGLAENFRFVSKNFKTILGNTFASVLIAFAINYGLSALTCGVGLILSVPLTMVFFASMYNVMYFNANGLRYYIDKDRIITSKKLEDYERIKDMKDII